MVNPLDYPLITVFPPHRDIHQTYDLKGSTVGREFDESKLKHNPKGPLKDLNWINRGMSLQLGPRKKNLVLSQLKKDVEVTACIRLVSDLSYCRH
jgi:1-phosphatidylinositol-4-phosphate 5-kinase